MRNTTLVLIAIVTASCLIVSQDASAAEFKLTNPPLIFENGVEIDGATMVVPDSFFDIFATVPPGGGQFQVDSFFDVFTELTIDPIRLGGPPVSVRITPGADTGSFDTEIVSMNLSGEIPGGPTVTVQAGTEFGLPSPGHTMITRVGTELDGSGRFHVDSFFDVFTELSIGGDPFTPSIGPARMEFAPGPGGQRHDAFSGELTPNGVVGGGTGWDGDGVEGGDWIEYPETVDPPWWNQWFYNDPLDMSRTKEIYWDITIEPIAGTNFGGPVEVAINWSNENFGGPVSGPPMAGDEPFIGREIIWAGDVEFDPDTGEPVRITRLEDMGDDPFTLPFNPEWISIDIRFADGTMMEGVMINGAIWHECVPEPTTMALLALGGLAVLRRRRRK